MTASTSAFCLLANPTARSTALVANSVSLEVLESRVSIQSNNSSDFSSEPDDLEFELDFVFEPELDFVEDFDDLVFFVEDLLDDDLLYFEAPPLKLKPPVEDPR